MSQILVTGATGCVGSNLCRRLIADGHEVSVLILPGTWHPFLDGLTLNVVVGDIKNRQDVVRAMTGCEYVYQVAGIVSYHILDHKKMYGVHYDGVRTVLEVAQQLGIKKIVITSSTAGIGIPEDKNQPLNEEASFDLKKYKKVMYMYSKHLTIKLGQEFAQKGLTVSIISPTTIYGQGDVEMHIGKVIKKIKEGRIHYAPPGGNAVISVDDVIDAHVLVMERGRSGENYIVADECMSYLELFNRIATVLNVPRLRGVTPFWILPYATFILTMIEQIMAWFKKKPPLSPHSLNFSFKCRYFDSSKARRELGWQPKVSFEAAIKKAIKFYEEHGLI